jgi:hypothetical protein
LTRFEQQRIELRIVRVTLQQGKLKQQQYDE